MNKVVKEQLGKCKVADIPAFDDTTTHIFIPKVSAGSINEYHLHKYFMVEIADYILNPSADFTLADNWNKGTKPPSKYMNVEIIQVMGKMIQISGVSYNPENPVALPTHWEGWIPQKSIKIIKQL